MLLNKKAQVTVFGVIFAFIAFAIIFIHFAPVTGYWGHDVVVNNNLSGSNAFYWNNLNLWITFTALIAFMLRFSG